MTTTEIPRPLRLLAPLKGPERSCFARRPPWPVWPPDAPPVEHLEKGGVFFSGSFVSKNGNSRRFPLSNTNGSDLFFLFFGCSEAHTIHGTGIFFATMNGWFLWYFVGTYMEIYHTWMVWEVFQNGMGWLLFKTLEENWCLRAPDRLENGSHHFGFGLNPWDVNNWLVVSTHLRNISQIASFPQVGVKIRNVWNHHLDNVHLSSIHFSFQANWI